MRSGIMIHDTGGNVVRNIPSIPPLVFSCVINIINAVSFANFRREERIVNLPLQKIIKKHKIKLKKNKKNCVVPKLTPLRYSQTWNTIFGENISTTLRFPWVAAPFKRQREKRWPVEGRQKAIIHVALSWRAVICPSRDQYKIRRPVFLQRRLGPPNPSPHLLPRT